MTTRPLRCALGAVLVLVLVGCGTNGPSDADRTAGGPTLPAGSWELTSGEGPDGALALLDTHPVTLEVGDAAVSGTAACNSYQGSIATGDDGPVLGPVAVTEMGCTPAAAMVLEQRYLAALARVESGETRRPGLVLTGPSVRLEFRRVRSAPEPTLTGGPWVVETVVAAGGPDGSVASASGETVFRFGPRGRLEVRACDPWAGRWTAEGEDPTTGRLTVSGAGVYDSIPCTAQRQQETEAVGRLGAGGGAWRIEGGRLTITAADGSALVLVRADVGARS